MARCRHSITESTGLCRRRPAVRDTRPSGVPAIRVRLWGVVLSGRARSHHRVHPLRPGLALRANPARMIADMASTPGRSARTIVAAAAMVALCVVATPLPVSGWGNAGDGYATHDWVVDQALDILDAAGRRPAWFDRDLA